MLPSFLSRPLRRLRADGAVETLGAREPALGRPTVLLARELCRFEPFTPPQGVSRSAGAAAARLAARTRTPFGSAGSAVARKGPLFGLWWWDAGRVGAMLRAAGVEEPVRLRPEAAAQTVAEGWRVQRLDGGYEAQRWRGGALLASAWRRSAFDAAAWDAFARPAAGREEAPPALAPAASPALVVSGSPYARQFADLSDLRGGLPAVAMLAAAASLGLSAFFFGRGVEFARHDSRLREEIVRLQGATTDARAQQVAARARGFAALGALVDRPGPLERVAEVQALLARFGLRVEAFDAAPDEVAVTVSASAAAGIDLLVEELQAQSAFADVRPTLDRASGTLTLRLRVRA